MTVAPWLLSALGILVLWLISKGVRVGWYLGLLVDGLFVTWFVYTHQWGLVPSSIAYAGVRLVFLTRRSNGHRPSPDARP